MSLFSKKNIRIPKHVGIFTDFPLEGLSTAIHSWTERALKMGIPVLTILISHESDEQVRAILHELHILPMIDEHQIKVSILGAWYSLSEETIQNIKKVIEKTKNYDNFFLNLCVNYDGQAEIINACKLIARQVQTGKIIVEAIDETLVKENLFTSSFVPPEIIIICGFEHCLHNFLLWDCGKSKIFFTGKSWKELSENTFEKYVIS